MDKINLSAEQASLIQLVLDGDYKLKDGALHPTRRLIRIARKAEKDKRLQTVSDFYTSWIEDVALRRSRLKLSGPDYYSVKPTSSSSGLLPAVLTKHPEITRQDVLDFFSARVKDGSLEKVGLKGGVEIPLEEANNFQIRYRQVIVAAPSVVDEQGDPVFETVGLDKQYCDEVVDGLEEDSNEEG